MNEIISKIDNYLHKLKDLPKEDCSCSNQEAQELLTKVSHFIKTKEVLNEEAWKRASYFKNLITDEEFIDIIYNLTKLSVKIAVINKELKSPDTINKKLYKSIKTIVENLKNIEEKTFLEKEVLSDFNRLINYKTKEDLCISHKNTRNLLCGYANENSLINPEFSHNLHIHFYESLYRNNVQVENEDILSFDNKLFFLNCIQSFTFCLKWNEICEFLNEENGKKVFESYSENYEFLNKLNRREFFSEKNRLILNENLKRYNPFFEKLREKVIDQPTIIDAVYFQEIYIPLTQSDNCCKKIEAFEKVLEQLKDFCEAEQVVKNKISRHKNTSEVPKSKQNPNKYIEFGSIKTNTETTETVVGDKSFYFQNNTTNEYKALMLILEISKNGDKCTRERFLDEVYKKSKKKFKTNDEKNNNTHNILTQLRDRLGLDTTQLRDRLGLDTTQLRRENNLIWFDVENC